MYQLGTGLKTEIYTTLGTTDIHILNLRTLGEMFHDGSTVEYRIHLQAFAEVAGHIAENDMQALTEEMLEGIGKIIVKQRAQTTLCSLLTLTTDQTINLVSIGIDQFTQDVDTKIACSTSQQHIA